MTDLIDRFPHASTCDFDLGDPCTCHVAALAEKDREIQRLIHRPECLAIDIKIASLEAENERLRQALLRFYDPEDCGDHCSNSCKQCQAAEALKDSK